MKKIIIFFTYFVFFNLSTVQSIAYIDKLTDNQKDLINSHYFDCIETARDKFRLHDIPETTQEMLDCGIKSAKLIYKSFDSIQDRDHYYYYHEFRYKIGKILIDGEDENQVIEGLKHLENMFNDPIYEKNILASIITFNEALIRLEKEKTSFASDNYKYYKSF